MQTDTADKKYGKGDMATMKTLIELFDERPVENVLATEVFRPEKTVFLCPPEIAENKSYQKKMALYFRGRKINTALVFIGVDRYNTEGIKKELRRIVTNYPDCVLDITGGSESALFACGMLCAEYGIPAFTYSRKRNCFFNVHNAPFADRLTSGVTYSIEDYFLMAGGAMRDGRFNNKAVRRNLDKFNGFFDIYTEHKFEWQRIVNYIQKISSLGKNEDSLHIEAPFSIKSDKDGTLSCPSKAMERVNRLGLISNFKIDRERTVSFDFRDNAARLWLRDVGSVLELYVYKTCLDTGIFDEVRTSVIVDWEGTADGDCRTGVTNEIDVMATKRVTPVFISCKTCHVGTEALNELAILRDRFGGKQARAVIVTTQFCRAVTRRRATELDITVIDMADIKNRRLARILIDMMNNK